VANKHSTKPTKHETSHNPLLTIGILPTYHQPVGLSGELPFKQVRKNQSILYNQQQKTKKLSVPYSVAA
jgi:hypothetical protein